MSQIAKDASDLERELEQLVQQRARATERVKQIEREREKILSNGMDAAKLRDLRKETRELKATIEDLTDEYDDLLPAVQAVRRELGEVERRRIAVEQLEVRLNALEVQVEIAGHMEAIGRLYAALEHGRGHLLPSVAELGRAATTGRWVPEWLPKQIRDDRDRCARELDIARRKLKDATR